MCKIAGYEWDTHKLTALAGLSKIDKYAFSRTTF